MYIQRTFWYQFRISYVVAVINRNGMFLYNAISRPQGSSKLHLHPDRQVLIHTAE